MKPLIFEIIDWILSFIVRIGLIYKIFIFIFFIHHFHKKTPIVSNPYFYLLATGFFWDLIALIFSTSVSVCHQLSSPNQCFAIYLLSSNAIAQWYTSQYSAIWTLILAINRLTAIIFWQKHKDFWDQHFFKFTLLMLIYPFLLNGYSFINYRCRLNYIFRYCDNSKAYWQEDAYVTTIASGSLAVIALIVGIITAWCYRSKISHKIGVDHIDHKTEQKLLFQSFIISVTYVCYCIIYAMLQYIDRKIENLMILMVMEYCRSIMYIVFHLCPYILVFVISSSLRKLLFHFYGFHKFHYICHWPHSTSPLPSSQMMSNINPQKNNRNSIVSITR